MVARRLRLRLLGVVCVLAGVLGLAVAPALAAPIAPETPERLPAESVTATTATLQGVLNPLAERKAEPGGYEFLYKKSASECEGEFATPFTEAAGAQGEAVSAPVTELLPHTQYTFCLRAINEVGEIATSAPSTFVTAHAAAPTVAAASVSDVTSSSATLLATIDPRGAATTYTFEYAPAGGSFVPLAGGQGKGSLPEGIVGVPVSVHVQLGLAAHTAYQFRVVATNSVGEFISEPVSFTTRVAGEALVLPDGREWEQVSLPVKSGGEIIPASEESFIQAAAGGDAITYTSLLAPLEANPAGFVQDDQVFSWRTAGDWASRDLNTPHEHATGAVVGIGGESKFFTPDLSVSLVQPFGDGSPPLSARATERTIYLRDDAPVAPEAAEQALYGEAEAEAPAGTHVGLLPLVTPANVPPGTEFGGTHYVRFAGASSDLSHVALNSTAPLTPKAVEAELGGGLYEWSGGRLQLVSVLPGASEEPVNGHLGGANEGDIARGAVSADGARVFWATGPALLYMRDTVRGETLLLETPEPECVAKGKCEVHPLHPEVQFQFATGDGSKVFFTDNAPLTSNAGARESLLYNDLYECEIVESAGKSACNLSDLTPLGPAGNANVHSPIVGASEDGAYVYIVAEGVLAEGATPGHNLYLLHHSGGQWTTRFIAKLSEADQPDWSSLVYMPARVSPDGRYLAFMSQRSLTGYNNLDANTGQPDEEVYLYHAETSESGELEPGHLICASCDPSGARPVGVEAKYPQLINDTGIWPEGTELAADVPGWVGSYGRSRARYQPRYLSDSGRLFFNSVDPLVPQAANGVADVYEYQPAGLGSCTSSSTTFGAASDGCVALISGASSGEESAFLDASENGDDVFFLTSARLAAQDLDTAFDVYDAHVCSAAAPCPAVTVSPPPCTTADSCRAAPAPQPTIFGAPSSATFSGAGNVTPGSTPSQKTKSRPKTTRCRKGAEKHNKCVETKSKKKVKVKRIGNHRRAKS